MRACVPANWLRTSHRTAVGARFNASHLRKCSITRQGRTFGVRARFLNVVFDAKLMDFKSRFGRGGASLCFAFARSCETLERQRTLGTSLMNKQSADGDEVANEFEFLRGFNLPPHCITASL